MAFPTTSPGRRVRWRHSLRTRLTAWSLLASVLLLVGVTAVFYAGIRNVLIETARIEMRNLAQQSARGLLATLDSVQVSGQTLAASASGVGREPMVLRSLLMATVVADPDIAGAMLIIEPGQLAPDDPGFTWYVRREGQGIKEQSVTDLGYDYRVMPWYIRTTTSPAPWWSEPYANPATGEQPFITYNLPLRRPGTAIASESIGIVSVDVPVARLRALLGEIPESEHLRPVLMSPERLLVLHPDPYLQMQYSLDDLVREHGREDLAPMLEALRNGRYIEMAHLTAAPSEGTPANETRYSFGIPVGHTGWSFALSVSEGYVLAQLNRITGWVLAGSLAALLLCVLAVRRFAGLIARPIEDLTDSARHFAQGEFDYPLGHVGRRDEVGVMARAFDSARDSIKRQLVEIAEMGAARSRLESELSIAREIQLAMLPSGSEFNAGTSHLEFDGLLEPAKAVGGDFYNFYQRDSDSLWFVIGDVSDKGVPAALFMARTMTVLEVAAQLGGSPGHALHEAAKHLLQGNDACMFATVLCGVVELRTGALSLASAGHEAPVLLRADGRRELLPVPTEVPLGVEGVAQYPVWRGRLLPGDTLFTYTDGITEAFDADNQAFGSERLLAALDPARDARQQCRDVVAQVHAFAGGTPQSDDITVLAIRYRRDASGRGRFTVRAALQPPHPRDAVRQLIAEMDAGLASKALPQALVHDLHLVLEEVASNILNHGMDDDRQPALELEVAVEPRRLVIEFRDDGPAFDPLSLPPPDLDADIADRPIGGLGVALIRGLAEEVAYARVGNHNVLRIVLPLPENPS